MTAIPPEPAPSSGPAAASVLRQVFRQTFRIAVVALLALAIYYCLARLRSVIIATLVGVVLAYIMRPMAGWLARNTAFVAFHSWFVRTFVMPFSSAERKQRLASRPLTWHTRRVIASFYVLVLLFVGFWYAGKLLATPFVKEIRSAAMQWGTGSRTDLKVKLDRAAGRVRDWYEHNVSEEWRQRFAQGVKRASPEENLPDRITGLVTEMVSKAPSLARYVVEIVLLPVLAFYFTIDSRKLKKEFVGTLPRGARREALRLIHEFNGIMNSYVVGQAILCLIAGIFVWILLVLLRVEYALTLAILAGLTRAIPIIGPIIGGIPIVGLVLLNSGTAVAVTVLIAFTLMHFAESKFIMPYLIGERVNLHPVLIILVLLIGEEFGGLLGMFFAAPVAALVRVIVRRYWVSHQRAA